MPEKRARPPNAVYSGPDRPPPPKLLYADRPPLAESCRSFTGRNIDVPEGRTGLTRQTVLHKISVRTLQAGPDDGEVSSAPLPSSESWLRPLAPAKGSPCPPRPTTPIVYSWPVGEPSRLACTRPPATSFSRPVRLGWL